MTMLRSVGVLVLLLLCATPAAAQTVPSHCERATESGWPAVGEPIDTTEPAPVTAAEARRAVRAFRAAWRRVPHPGAALRSVTECMNASVEHFVVRRVSVAHARRSSEDLVATHASMVLAGSASALPTSGWVWEVYWGGGSRSHPRGLGQVSAYFAADLSLLTAVQWLEG